MINLLKGLAKILGLLRLVWESFGSFLALAERSPEGPPNLHNQNQKTVG
jgi:hypothetical protein